MNKIKYSENEENKKIDEYNRKVEKYNKMLEKGENSDDDF